MSVKKTLFVLCSALACSRAQKSALPSGESAPTIPSGCPAGSVRVASHGPDLDCEEDKPGDQRALHGPFVHYWPNHKPAEMGTRTKGMRDGLYQQWNEQGELIARGSYRDGLRQGAWITWWSTAPGRDVRVEETFEKGVRIGEPRILDHGGRVLTALEASTVCAGRGSENAMVELKDEWGKGLLRGPLFKGLRNGAWTSWFAPGKQAAEVGFENGVRNGAFRTFWPDGRPAAHGTFAGGTVKELWSDDLHRLDDEITLKLETATPIRAMASVCDALVVATQDRLYALGAGPQPIWERTLQGLAQARVERADFTTDSSPCLVRVASPDFVTYLDGKDGHDVTTVKPGFSGAVSEIAGQEASSVWVVGVDDDTLRGCDIKSGECKLSWKARASVTSPLVLHGGWKNGRLWFGDAVGMVYVLPAGGTKGEFVAQPIRQLSGAVREIVLQRDAYGLFLQDAPKRRQRADCAYGVGSPTTMTVGPIPKPLLIERAKAVASFPEVGVVLDGNRLAWSSACVLDDDMARRGFDTTDDVHPIIEDDRHAALLTVAGDQPAVMRLAWIMNSDSDRSVAGPWILPDALTCPGRALVQHTGRLAETPVWFACRDSRQVFSVDLRKLVDKQTSLSDNRIWSAQLPPGFQVPEGDYADSHLHNGMAYVSFASERKVCAIDLASGVVVFCRGSAKHAFEVVADGIWVSLDSDGVLRAYNGVTGDPMWRYDDFDRPRAKRASEQPEAVARLFSADGVVAVVHREEHDSEVQGLDIRTGSPLYRTTIPSFPSNHDTYGENRLGTFYVDGHRVALRTEGGLVYLDVKTGKADVVLDGVQGSTAEGDKIVATRGDEILATDFAGVVQWSAKPCHGDCLFSEMVGVGNGIVWAQTKRPTAGREYCVRLKTGKPASCRDRAQERSIGDDKLDFMGPYETPTDKAAVDEWLALVPSRPGAPSRTLDGVDTRRSPGVERLRPPISKPVVWRPHPAEEKAVAPSSPEARGLKQPN